MSHGSSGYWSGMSWQQGLHGSVYLCLMWQSNPRKSCGLTGAVAWAVIRIRTAIHCLARIKLSCDAGDLGCSMLIAAILFDFSLLYGELFVLGKCWQLTWACIEACTCVWAECRRYWRLWDFLFAFAVQQSFRRAHVRWTVCSLATGEIWWGKEPSVPSQLSDSPSACVAGNKYRGICKKYMWQGKWERLQLCPSVLMGVEHTSSYAAVQPPALSELVLTI